MSARYLAKWFGFLLVASIAMYLASDFVLYKDEARPAIEQFLANNTQVSFRIGKIKEAELVKRVSVAASGTSKAYRLYTFTVKGETDSAIIIVRVEDSALDPSQESFVITKLNLD